MVRLISCATGQRSRARTVLRMAGVGRLDGTPMPRGPGGVDQCEVREDLAPHERSGEPSMPWDAGRQRPASLGRWRGNSSEVEHPTALADSADGLSNCSI